MTRHVLIRKESHFARYVGALFALMLMMGLSMSGIGKAWAADTTPPTDPVVSSPSHTVDQINSDTTVEVTWPTSGAGSATDDVSGVDGFSFSWSSGATEEPDVTKDVEETTGGVTSEALADGSWYFNLRTVDNDGNWTSTVHMGPFVINTTQVKIWPRWSAAPFGYWSKLAGTVKDGSGSLIANTPVDLQYKDGSTWKWFKTVNTNSAGYYQHWFYYEDGTRTYRSIHKDSGVISNLTTVTFKKNIGAWNNYRPKTRYCQWTKLQGKYGGPDGVYPNATLYLQRWDGSKWVWQATVKTDPSGYYAAWASVCPTTKFRMGTWGSAVTSPEVTKMGTTIIAWENSKVHAVIRDGYGSSIPGMWLYLQKWNGSTWVWQASCKTSSTGYCNFGTNNPSGTVRVATWGSKVVSGTF